MLKIHAATAGVLAGTLLLTGCSSSARAPKVTPSASSSSTSASASPSASATPSSSPTPSASATPSESPSPTVTPSPVPTTEAPAQAPAAEAPSAEAPAAPVSEAPAQQEAPVQQAPVATEAPAAQRVGCPRLAWLVGAGAARLGIPKNRHQKTHQLLNSTHHQLNPQRRRQHTRRARVTATHPPQRQQ